VRGRLRSQRNSHICLSKMRTLRISFRHQSSPSLWKTIRVDNDDVIGGAVRLNRTSRVVVKPGILRKVSIASSSREEQCNVLGC
jgi:hypothetical protein